jgi:hypothetical protein
MPQKKTRKNNHKTKTKTKINHNHSHRNFYRTPTPYPFSPMQNISGIVSSSSAAMKAVSRDGKHCHVDANINGEKEHANLTNSQIMDILAYPAAKQDLRTQLIQKLRDMSPRHMHDERPIFIAPNLGAPIIRMYEPREPREHQKIEYIYKNGCSNKPIMLNKLSPLHEARIIPEMDGESIHLIPKHMHSHNESKLSELSELSELSGLSELSELSELSSIRKANKKIKNKGKGKGKGKGKTVNKKGKK